MSEPLRLEDLPQALQDLLRWCDGDGSVIAQYMAIEWPVVAPVTAEPWLPEENWAQREKRFLNGAFRQDSADAG